MEADIYDGLVSPFSNARCIGRINSTPSYPVFPITLSLTPLRSWLSAEVCCLFSCLWVGHWSPTKMFWPHLHAVSRAVCGMWLGAWLIWHLVAGAGYELPLDISALRGSRWLYDFKAGRPGWVLVLKRPKTSILQMNNWWCYLFTVAVILISNGGFCW